MEGRIDGVVSTSHMGRQAYLRMIELGVPVVLTFEYEDLDLPAVAMDSFKLFEEATSLAVQAGWRARRFLGRTGGSRALGGPMD